MKFESSYSRDASQPLPFLLYWLSVLAWLLRNANAFRIISFHSMYSPFLPMQTVPFQEFKVQNVPSQYRATSIGSNPCITILSMSSWNQNESEEDMKRRMELVRSIQETYYKSENGNVPTLDPSTGILHHLPLWRVSWTELPGRSNVLNVHEPTYTNMFEIILNRPKPWLFGHLFLPGGSSSLRSAKPRFQLQSWHEYNNNINSKRFTGTMSQTAVVGTLMKIVDFRRLQDGRLCLLVHAMERFVVQDAIQNLPYSIAHVQILPDWDSDSPNMHDGVQHSASIPALTTTEEQSLRAKQVSQAFQYHPYEYKETPLPLSSNDKYLSLGQVYGSWLSTLLPFASYHLDANLLMFTPTTSTTDAGRNRSLEDFPLQNPELCSLRRLLEQSILKLPSDQDGPSTTVSALELLSNDQLEALLWDALEEYCVNKRIIKLPDQVLCLLPLGRLWMGAAVVGNRRVSRTHYPAARRQNRLSFVAAHWLEPSDHETNIRQVFLEIPTTKARLIDLIQRFTVLNDELKGEFQ